MMFELFVILTYCLPGLVLVHACQVRGAVAAPLGYIVGVGLYVAVGAAQVFSHVSVHPGWTMAMVWLIGLTTWLLSPSCRWADVRFPALGGLCLGVAALVYLSRSSGYVGWHSDSFRYAISGGLLASDQMSLMSAGLLRKRMLAYGLVQAPAGLIGAACLRSFAPLLGIATAWVLGWMTYVALGVRGGGSDGSAVPPLTPRLRLGLASAVVLLLVSYNRFVWNAIYINGHLLFAACLLAHSGVGWLRLRGQLPSIAAIVVQSLALVTITLVRPEGALVAMLASLPFVVADELEKRERIIPFLALAATTLVWNVFIGVQYKAMPGENLGMIALAVVCFAAAPVALWPRAQRWLKFVLPATEGALWLALVGLSMAKPTVLANSLQALKINLLLDGSSWGSSIVILTVLVGGLVVSTRAPHRGFLSFPVTTYMPLALALAFLRGAAYRDGDRDSFVRMLIHIVPLAVLVIGASLNAEWRQFQRPSPRPVSRGASEAPEAH